MHGDDISSTSEEEENCLQISKNDLKTWALDANISHKSLNGLLKLVHHCSPNLPLDSRSLLSTCRKSCVINMGSGKFLHQPLNLIIDQVSTSSIPVELVINIDGVSLYRSKRTQLWPILGSVNNLPSNSYGYH